MRKTLLCILLVTSFETLASDWEFLPRGRLSQLSWADPREVRMALQFGGSGNIEAHVGNYFSLFGWQDTEKDWRLNFGIEGAGFFSLRQQGSRFPLDHTDGLIGLYAESSKGPWQFRLRYTHVSSHLSDGSSGEPIAYSREFLKASAAFVESDRAHVYGGLRYSLNSIPKLPAFEWFAGGSYVSPWPWKRARLFAACHVSGKDESEFNPSLNLQLGVSLNKPQEAYRSFRIYYQYFTGADPRGQYYTRSFTSQSIGVEMQI